MRRFALLLAAGSLWLFLAAVPTLADGGPHVASVNSGSTSLTADGCAGCHRAHTAQGEGLLVQPQESLCLSCHGATGTGATTDVLDGIQYKPGTTGPLDTTPKSTNGVVLGYLRDGGFQNAHIGGSDGQLVRVGYNRAKDTVSERTKVPAEATADAVTSAHLDLDGVGGVVAKNRLWGSGLNGTAADPVAASLACTSCHNVHGNGQYRILQKLDKTDQYTMSTPINVSATKASTDRIFTSEAHGLIVGDIVTMTGVGGIADGQYIVKTTAGNAFQVAATTANGPKTADIANPVIDIAADGGAGGTVKRWASIVDDAPLPAAGDTRNYTVIQVKGNQNAGTGYLLYASNVTTGAYDSASGDYFHRTVPWNPGVNDATCNTDNPPASAKVACQTANDAPNGHPATWNGTTVTATQIAFNDQISAWCATCHTRYYSSTNTNPGIISDVPADLEASSTPDTAKSIASSSGNDIVSPAGSAFGYALGDQVKFSAATDPTKLYFVIAYATTGTGASQVATMQVSGSLDGPVTAAPAGSGTVIRVYPFSASSWYFPRNSETDTNYKYQHQTTTNRACTTCHVGHGTDAQMTAGLTSYSRDLAYPGGTAATAGGYNSRLLKIDNRGTCEACHDPTSTLKAGDIQGATGNNTLP